MIFLVAIAQLFVFIAANGLAIATLVGSSWKTTIALAARRRRLSRVALYSVPVAAIARFLILLPLSARLGLSFGSTLASVGFAGFLPLLASNRTAQVLEGFEIRDLLTGRD